MGGPGASDPRPRHRLDHEPVLIVSGCEGATRRYRCLHQAEQLFLRGIPVRVVTPWQHDIVDAGLGHGFIILHRVAWDPTVQMLIDQTRDTGGVALFDIDDLVFEPESTPLHRGIAHLPPDELALYHDGVRRYRRTLHACDGAIVPTAFLAERVRALGVPAWISRNCVDLELMERSRRAGEQADRDPDRVIIGYASGSRTHDEDFAEAAGPAILEIMRRRPEVELRIVGPLGLGPEWDDVRHRVDFVGAVDWRALSAEIAAFDINIAPLELESPFCRAKSELKWLEASACGVPTVASATGAFADAIRDGVDGLLADDEASWTRAIESLIDGPVARREIGAAAREAIVERRNTVAQSEGFERTLAEARATIRPETRPPSPPAIVDGRFERGLAIAILAPEPTQGSGGHTTLMRMVGGLESAGHRVTLHIEPGPRMEDASEQAVEAFMRAHFPATGAMIRFGEEIGPCDVAIATGWTTALRVAAAECARTKLYFVQDFEPYFQPLSADALAAESTYTLGLGHITIGPWLAETLRETYGARAEAIDFGVEHDVYAPAGAMAGTGAIARSAATEVVGAIEGTAAIPEVAAIARSAATEEVGAIPGTGAGAPPRVVFYARGATARRGVSLGIEALGRVKAARPEVEIVLYGGERPGVVSFPHVDAGILSRPALASLYRSATVGIALSYTNLSLVPIEMAACGLPVVAIDAEPVRWYQVDGETCHLVAPTAEAVAAGVLRVLDDSVLRERLAKGGLERVASMTWERAGERFVGHVERYAAEDVRTDGDAGGRTAVAVVAPHLVTLTGDPSPRRTTAELEAEAKAMVEAEEDSFFAEMTSTRRIVLASGASIGIDIRPSADGLRRVEVRASPVAGAVAGDLVMQVLEHESSPRAIATAAVAWRSIPDEAWAAFDLRPIARSAGRRLHLRLVAMPARGKNPPEWAPLVMVDLDADEVPVHRLWCDPPGADIPVGAADDPEVRDLIHRRRRSVALRRLRLAQLRRRKVLAATSRFWWRWTRPIPAGPLRPWRADAPPADKLLAGLRIYGPLSVACEIIAWLRYRLGGGGT